MKRFALLIILCLTVSYSFSETHYILCRVTTNLNLREGPSSQYDIIGKMPKNSYFVAIMPDGMETYSGMFVYGLYVGKDVYGYVCETYLDVVEEIETDQGGVLSKVGESYGYDPEVEITNSSNAKITVRIDDTNYPFNPHQVRTIICSPGKVSIFASSPGVIPYSATDYISSNCRYTWKFYIETRYR